MKPTVQQPQTPNGRPKRPPPLPSASKQKGDDDEPKREDWRKELIGKLQQIGGIDLHTFIVESGYRKLDSPVLKSVIEALDKLFVTCGGTVYRYDDERGVYAIGEDALKQIITEIGERLREERRQIDLVLGTLPKSKEDALASLLPKLNVDGKFVERHQDFLTAAFEVPGVEMDSDKQTINMLNGLLDRETLTRRDHTSEHPSSIQLPYAFNPKATCPRWLKFLNEVLPDAEEQALFQEVVGYLLVPTTELEVAVVLLGQGGTGKGTAIKVIQELVGQANCSHIALDKLGERFQAIELRGKLVNVCPEVDASKTIDESMFKSLVSGDHRTVERKYKDPEPLVSHARMLMPANGMPNIKDPTNAFFDRLFIFNFNQQFRRQISTDTDKQLPSADPKLLETLKGELSGIFNWAIEGMQRLFARGKFEPPATVLRRAVEYRQDQNPVFRFLDQYPEKGPNRFISTADLYEDYCAWCAAEGHKHVWDRNVFGKRVAQANYPGVKAKKGKERGFTGLGPPPSQKRPAGSGKGPNGPGSPDAIFGDA